MMELPDSMREKILREVIDTAPFPIGVYTGHKMKIVLANKCMIETYGKGPDVIGRNYTEILPELENQEIFEQLRDVLMTGKSFEAKNSRVDIIIEGKLKPHYFNYNFTPIYGKGGQIYGVMNTAAEVTALNVSRQQTIEIEKRLRLAVESSKLGTYEIDMKSGIITGSKRFLNFFDMYQNDLSLSNAASFVHIADQKLWKKEVKKIYETGSMQCEIRIGKGDPPSWIRFSGTLSESDNKENIVVGIAQDITEEKQLSEKLKQMVEQQTFELRRSNDDLKQFGHIISHDLKEPIRKISMFSNLLSDSIDSGQLSRISQFSQKISKSSTRVTEMIDAVLNYASSDSSQLNEIVDLNSIIKGIEEDLEAVIIDKKAHIEYANIPLLNGSKILFHQLFYNLINNSLKFSRCDHPPYIKIECVKLNKHFHIIVTDNGIGIEPQNSEKIFKTFERLHSKDEFEGTGLGLALCKKIVERHQGKIRHIPAQDTGSIFEIIFPSAILS